ncbi:lysozyme family protein [Citrobacter portucalensis]|uniref:hypothetical protein n=1 Tax=Citrobacter portucalensis TaxID=1639133 RepID=UPI00226B0815|nr:hypothetical protein [Citrobacter portucalensis]MCX8986028.1 hypothetical protein [Citrobacter portucalensis]
MSGIENSNQGPGWSDHNTPYGTIHSYDGTGGSFSASGNGGGNHTGVTDHTTINIASTSNYNGVMMSMCVNNLKVHEGFITHLYKDSNGYITVGIGHLLATAEMAAALPFTRTQTYHGHGDEMEREISMSHDEIVNVYNNYKNSSNVPPEGMHLSNDNVVTQCVNDVQTTITGLKGLYSEFDSFPNSAKTALVDMGFNLGISRLHNEFPHFNDAVNRKDWSTAATESHRVGIGTNRNNDTRDQLLRASQGH